VGPPQCFVPSQLEREDEAIAEDNNEEGMTIVGSLLSLLLYVLQICISYMIFLEDT